MIDPRLSEPMSPDELMMAMFRIGCRTNVELAERIGVTRSTAGNWTRGYVGVPRPIRMLIRLLVAEAQQQRGVVDIRPEGPSQNGASQAGLFARKSDAE